MCSRQCPQLATIMTRSELFTAIWSAPMTEVAKTLGVSDTALADICRRGNIPRPYRGFWRQRATGHAPAVPPLPHSEVDPVIDGLAVDVCKTPAKALSQLISPSIPCRQKLKKLPESERQPPLLQHDGTEEYRLVVDQVERYQSTTKLLNEIERRTALESAIVQSVGQEWLMVVRTAHAAANPADLLMARLKGLAGSRGELLAAGLQSDESCKN